MGVTANYSWPYPASGDAPDVPADMKDLADAIDADLPGLLTGVLTGLLTGSDVGYAQVLTAQTTSSLTYVDLATVGPSVTLTSQGTKALCIWSTQMDNATPASGTAVSLAISGATTLAASDDNALGTNVGNTGFGFMAATFALVSINTGANTFKLQYRCGGATVGTFGRRKLFVLAP